MPEINGVKLRRYKGALTKASQQALAAAKVLELPQHTDLLDPVSRDSWLARLGVYVLEGRISPAQVNQVVRVARELRENTRIADIRRQVLALVDQLNALLAAKSGMSVADVEGVLKTVSGLGVAS